MSKSLNEFAAVTIFTLSLGGCTTTTPQIGEVGCEGQPRVVVSTRDFIRIRHRERDSRRATEMGREWCEAQDAIAEKATSTCSGCCVTAYQCR